MTCSAVWPVVMASIEAPTWQSYIADMTTQLHLPAVQAVTDGCCKKGLRWLVCIQVLLSCCLPSVHLHVWYLIPSIFQVEHAEMCCACYSVLSRALVPALWLQDHKNRELGAENGKLQRQVLNLEEHKRQLTEVRIGLLTVVLQLCT